MTPEPDAEPTKPTLQPHRRIVELDALRAVAAINLVLFHFTHVYQVKFGYNEPLGWEWPFGAYGVEMFFILSGFVNSMSLLRRGRPVDFVAARVIRIAPIFLLVIVANLWVVTYPPLSSLPPVTTGQFFTNLTLMPNVFGYQCVDPVMWTLQVEIMFYGVLAALFRIGALRHYFLGWGTLVGLALFACPALDAAQATAAGTAWFAAANAVRHLLFLDFVPLFAIGFLLYMTKTGTGNRWANAAGIFAAAAVFHSIDHGKHNPAATLLILGVVTAAAYGRIPLLRLRPFVFISTISYAIYLCHNNLGCVMIHRFNNTGWSANASLALGIVLAFCLGVIVTLRIEQPMTRRLRAAWERYRSGEPVFGSSHDTPETMAASAPTPVTAHDPSAG